MGAMNIFAAAVHKSHRTREAAIEAALGESIHAARARWRHRRRVQELFKRNPPTIAELRALVEASGMQPRRYPMGAQSLVDPKSAAAQTWRR